MLPEYHIDFLKANAGSSYHGNELLYNSKLLGIRMRFNPAFLETQALKGGG
jgi:hypothetical protein